jgi:aspartate aminotransferase
MAAQVSHRAQSLAPSQTLKFSARSKELAAEGKSIVSLTAGEPDFFTPDVICEAAMEAIKAGHHGYTVNTGLPSLRERIAAKIKRDQGLDVGLDQIVVSNGAKQSIGFSMLATLNPGDEVIIPTPYWVSYPEMVRFAEGTPTFVRTTYASAYKMNAAQLEQAITPKTRGVILCSPSNPTGSCYTHEELLELAEVLRAHPDVMIYSDEIYEYLVYDGEAPSLFTMAPDLFERGVIINGFSKGFAMTGWRLGYMVAPAQIAKALAKIQSQETSAPSTISQYAGIAAYDMPLSDLEPMKQIFKSRRDKIVQRLQAIPGVKCQTPPGAFYVFPDISERLGQTTDYGVSLETSTDFCMEALEHAGLGMVPGDAFGEPNGIRLSFAASDDQLEAALSRLDTFVGGLTGTSS